MSKQRHRGPHPQDRQLFDDSALSRLSLATVDFGWLLDRGYATTAALKLVGDRYSLRKRQRDALLRCAASRDQIADRTRRRVLDIDGRLVAIDGFNCLITFEAILAGAPTFNGCDGVVRDLASVHGSYKRVSETEAALTALEAVLSPARECHWYFDAPVSNSGRVAEWIRQRADHGVLPWSAHVVTNPDRILCELDGFVVASSDSWILDHAPQWIDITGAHSTPSQWLIDFCAERRSAL